MAISAKGRRRIEVDGVPYLWWVAEDLEDDFRGHAMVTVASLDRALFVRYGLGQPARRRHVVVLGTRFRGVAGLGGPWRRFRCPQFGTAEVMGPRDVAAFIRWCLDTGTVPAQTDHLGQVIASTPEPRPRRPRRGASGPMKRARK